MRELTEGMLYSETVVAGAPEFRPNDDITVAMRVITRKGSNRVAREAFEIARTRPRKKVTAAHKEPVYRLACGMFAEECRKVAREYPDVTFEEAMIDTISMKLVMAPQQYDVVVTTNQFGDILDRYRRRAGRRAWAWRPGSASARSRRWRRRRTARRPTSPAATSPILMP